MWGRVRAEHSLTRPSTSAAALQLSVQMWLLSPVWDLATSYPITTVEAKDIEGSRSKRVLRRVYEGTLAETCIKAICIRHQAKPVPLPTERGAEGQAHLGRRGPGLHRLDSLLLLILLLLKLLGQFQVSKAQHALWLLLLQGQGNKVVLEGKQVTRQAKTKGRDSG